MPAWPDIALAHFELFVRDLARMERFYTEALGFEVNDRGEKPGGLVFLSRNPAEHHQLVLNPDAARRPAASPLDHISFRVAALADLRRFHAALAGVAGDLETVSHGNAWSIYFRDPEGNRLELFVDTPWEVAQPCRFEIDLGLSDEALAATTEARIRALPGFRRRGPG